jgi:hypothetical protein
MIQTYEAARHPEGPELVGPGGDGLAEQGHPRPVPRHASRTSRSGIPEMGAATTDLVRRDRRLGDGRRGERHGASKLRGFWHVHVLMRQSLSWGPRLSLQIGPHRFNGVEDRELRGSGPGQPEPTPCPPRNPNEPPLGSVIPWGIMSRVIMP